MIDLTYIFGDEIIVATYTRRIDRQRVGLPGAHGVLSMHMGSRGRQIIVKGKIWGSGNDYASARADCQAWLDEIDLYKFAGAADYTFMDDTYYNVEFDDIVPLPDKDGKTFHYNAEGYVILDFIAYLYQLI